LTLSDLEAAFTLLCFNHVTSLHRFWASHRLWTLYKWHSDG